MRVLEFGFLDIGISRHVVHFRFVFGNRQVEGIVVVGRCRGLQHGGRLGKMGPRFKQFGIGLNVGSQLGRRQFTAMNHFGRQIVKDARTIAIQKLHKHGFHGTHVSRVFLAGYFKAGMGHHEAAHFFKAGKNLFSRFLQILGISLGKDRLEIVRHFRLHGIQVVLLFKVLPIPHQKVNSLKGFLDLALGIPCFLSMVALECHSSIFGKECQLLQIVFLYALVYIVNLKTAQEGAESKNTRRQCHGGFVVKHALRIDQYHGNIVLLFRVGMDAVQKEGFAPHPNARRVAFRSSPPIKAILAQRLEPLIPFLGRRPILFLLQAWFIGGAWWAVRVQVKVSKKPTEQKAFSRAKGTHDRNDRHLPSGRDFRENARQLLLMKAKGIRIARISNRHNLQRMRILVHRFFLLIFNLFVTRISGRISGRIGILVRRFRRVHRHRRSLCLDRLLRRSLSYYFFRRHSFQYGIV
mmetsp:Transcript_18930/g.34316  ORF Transcript_18930/g.34316 Transcript_18930/m.34316 type:complete len:465 (+) Transcript_18930:6039-7433(+)